LDIGICVEEKKMINIFFPKIERKSGKPTHGSFSNFIYFFLEDKSIFLILYFIFLEKIKIP